MRNLRKIDEESAETETFFQLAKRYHMTKSSKLSLAQALKE